MPSEYEALSSKAEASPSGNGQPKDEQPSSASVCSKLPWILCPVVALVLMLLLGLDYLGVIQSPLNLGRSQSHVSNAPILHYYMYRVQNDEDYSPENQNMANIPGALWYLHNEIVWHHWLRAGTFANTPKTRLERYLVFSRASQELFARGMNFGVVNAYDLGKCTGPYKCENLQEYGPVVGCESWDPEMNNNFPHGQWVGKNVYPKAAWYSLPGKCSSKKFWDQQGDCVNNEPSGACPLGVVPTGEWTCTYTYQKVGELKISEIENITSFETLIEGGGREYDKKTDKGVHLHFWDNIDSKTACQARVDHVQRMFEKKYPEQPVLADPPCDFDINKFYPYYPAGTFTRPDSDAANTDASDSVNNTGDSAGEEAGDDGNSTIV